MTHRILIFGQLKDIIGQSHLDVHDTADTDILRIKLQEQYPKLRQASFVISVNRKIVHSKTDLTNGSEVALLPPFSGG